MTHWCGCENTAKVGVKHQLNNQIKVVNEHFRTYTLVSFFLNTVTSSILYFCSIILCFLLNPRPIFNVNLEINIKYYLIYLKTDIIID